MPKGLEEEASSEAAGWEDSGCWSYLNLACRVWILQVVVPSEVLQESGAPMERCHILTLSQSNFIFLSSFLCSNTCVAPQICTSHLYIHFHFRSLTLHSPSCHQARLVRRFNCARQQEHFPWDQSPRVGTMSSCDPGIILKWFGQVLKAQGSSVYVQFIWNPKKSTEVNCQCNCGFEGGRWLEMPHSCGNKSHLTFQTSTLKNLRSNQDFPKIAGDL